MYFSRLAVNISASLALFRISFVVLSTSTLPARVGRTTLVSAWREGNTREPIPPPLSRHARWGDINLALFVPIFSLDEVTGVCRNFNHLSGNALLIVEAFLFVLRDKYGYRLASDDGGSAVSLGYVVLDSCSSRLQTSDNLLETRWRAQSEARCSSCEFCDGNVTDDLDATSRGDQAVAVLGPNSDDVMVDLSPLLNALHTPHIVSSGPVVLDEYDEGASPEDDPHRFAYEYSYLFRSGASKSFFRLPSSTSWNAFNGHMLLSWQNRPQKETSFSLRSCRRLGSETHGQTQQRFVWRLVQACRALPVVSVSVRAN